MKILGLLGAAQLEGYEVVRKDNLRHEIHGYEGGGWRYSPVLYRWYRFWSANAVAYEPSSFGVSNTKLYKLLCAGRAQR